MFGTQTAYFDIKEFTAEKEKLTRTYTNEHGHMLAHTRTLVRTHINRRTQPQTRCTHMDKPLNVNTRRVVGRQAAWQIAIMNL